MVPYYIGAKAIAKRLGFRSVHTLQRLIAKENLPVHKRRVSNPSGTGGYQALAISESVITAWEIAKGHRFADQRRAKLAKTKEAKRYALTGE